MTSNICQALPLVVTRAAPFSVPRNLSEYSEAVFVELPPPQTSSYERERLLNTPMAAATMSCRAVAPGAARASRQRAGPSQFPARTGVHSRPAPHAPPVVTPHAPPTDRTHTADLHTTPAVSVYSLSTVVPAAIPSPPPRRHPARLAERVVRGPLDGLGDRGAAADADAGDGRRVQRELASIAAARRRDHRRGEEAAETHGARPRAEGHMNNLAHHVIGCHLPRKRGSANALDDDDVPGFVH